MASRTRLLRTSMAGRVRAPLFFALALLSLLALRHPALSRKPAPTPCPGGRFLLPAGAAPILSGGSADPDVVTIDDGHTPPFLAIASGCLAAPGTRKATKKRTTVKGQWPTCGAVAKVKLTAHVDAATCRTMTGTVTAKHTKRRRFTAVRSACGDGVVDPGAGEECEPGVLECDAGVCAQCTCAGPTTTSLPGTPTTSTTLPGGGTTTTTVTGATTSTTLAGATTTTLPTQPPPDPATIAPPNLPGVSTDFAAATAFLYGPGGTQVNVTPGAIVARSVAVLRGRVLDTAGAPLPATLISVVGHPEWGQTLSRTDGMFDLAVNGGAQLVVSYRKAGYVEVQRPANPRFKDWEVMPDVVLTPLDAAVTAVTLAGATVMQTAQGNPVTDTDGTRRATILFPVGTTADMVMPDGTTHPLGALHVRATELTVGAGGPAAMPGALPATSAYTYAVELSADEALAAGATEVRFSQPVPVYVDNFLGITVGTAVPIGFYDRGDGTWKGSPDGRVIQVLGATGGLADLDTDGDGLADGAAALAALGITDPERQTLAALYPAGHSLWRSLVPHFSSIDCNFPQVCGADCAYPNDPDPRKRRKPDDHVRRYRCDDKGSILACESQSVGEAVRVAGTPFALHYTSLWARGQSGNTHVKIPILGASVPSRLQHVLVTADVAGHHYAADLAPAPNLVFELAWDGTDAYGRPVHAAVPLTGRIDFRYGTFYVGAGAVAETSFGNSGVSVVPLSGDPARVEATLSRDFSLTISASDLFADRDLAGWYLSAHHRLDPYSGTVYFGSGAELPPPSGRATLVFGNGHQADNLQPARDGGFFAKDVSMLVHVGTDGGISPLLCYAASCAAPDDGVLATAAEIDFTSIKTGPDGLLYFVQSGFGSRGGRAIWRIEADGTLHRIAGLVAGVTPPPTAGAAAREVALNLAFTLAIGPEGNVYFYDATTAHVWRVTPAGTLAIVAGDGTLGTAFAGEGGFATGARFPTPEDIAAGPAGEIYFTAQSSNGPIQALVLRIRPDGIIERFAGGGCPASNPPPADGQPRLAACLEGAARLEFGPDGAIYLSQGLGGFYSVYRLGDAITRVTGGAPESTIDGAPPEAVGMGFTPAFTFSRAGTLLVSTNTAAFRGVREIQIGPPVLADGTIAVPSGSGAVVYLFDAAGRHLATRDRFTSGLVYQFSYDAAGHLATVTDGAGNVTTVERDGGGAPTAIVAPGGQRTAFTLDANGYLHTVADPGGHAITLGYAGVADGFAADSGLLKTFALPSGATSTFGYDADGALVSDTNALGGTTTLARVDLPNGFELTETGPTGETTVRQIVTLDDGTLERHVVGPAGGETVESVDLTGTATVTYDDGTVVKTVTGPDPRFGSYLPVAKTTTVKKIPLGQSIATNTRTITTAGTDWLGEDVLTDTRTVDASTWTAVFDRPQQKVTHTSPAGRVSTATVDASGRLLQASLDPGYATLTLAYDAKGLLSQYTRGGLHWTYGYDARNRRTSATDAASHVHAYTFDAADRPITASFPGAEVTTLGWDADAQLAGFIPPGGAAHTLASDGLGNELGYTPPGNPAYQQQYRVDGSLAKIILPSGRERVYGVDAGGRSTGVTYPEATVTYTYTGTSTFPAALTRTPVGAGNAHALAYTYATDLPTSVAASGAATGTYTYTYGPSFLLGGITLHSGADTVGYAITRDADRRVTNLGPLTFARGGPDASVSSIGDGASTLGIGYTPEGMLASRTLTAGGQARYALAVTWDAAGLPTARTETVGAVTIAWAYTYDARGRVTGVTRNGVAVEAYTYDTNGNRTSAAYDGSAADTATYDAQDRLASRAGAAYTFDTDGFLAAHGSDTFTYSAEGELLSATVGGTTVTYDYDALDRRVRRTAGAAVTEYLYGDLADPFRITAYRAPSGTLTSLLTDEAGILVAFERGGQRFFVGTDQVGSPRVVTNAAGTPVHVVEYDAFGRIRTDNDPTFDLPIGFAGGLADPVTGLVRFGLRDYEPASGRWTARDPARLGGRDFNLYAYVGSSPVGFRDPFGLFCVGASFFDELGLGAQICHTKDGTTVCGSTGVGVGGLGLEFAPTGGLADDFNGFGAEAGVRVRGVGSLGVDGSFGQYGDPYDHSSEHCFKSKGTIKGTFQRYQWDLLHLGQGPNRLIDLPDPETETKGIELEAKAVWKSCHHY